MKKRIGMLRNVVCRIIPIQFMTTPLLDIVDVLLGVALGLLLTYNVKAMQNLFDSISYGVANNGKIVDCFMPLLILAATTIGIEMVQGSFNFLADVIFKKSSGRIKMLLFRKLQKIDPAIFENPSFLDDLNKAREGISVMPYFCMSMYISISFYLVYFVSVGGYLYSLKPILLISVVLAFIPALFGQILRLHYFWKLENKVAPFRRRYEYYQNTMCDREYFKETRTLGAFSFFYKLFSGALDVFCKEEWKTEQKSSLVQIGLNITSFLGMGISTIILFDATVSGEISVGAFAAVFTALRALFSMMQQVIGGHIAKMNKNFAKVNNFVYLMDMPEITGESAKHDIDKGVVAENASFTYWGREKAAVKNISLSIGATETIAIVGENGAGKSTLVRMLVGIYRPTEGNIYIGGLNTKKTKASCIYNGISGVFQKVQKYKMNLGDNVILGVPSDIGKKYDIERIKSALDEAGFDYSKVDLDTMLSPEYGGIDVSGGQWQRLAIARGLYRINDFIVLDEPTAAIDPIEETRIYKKFQDIAKDKCAIIVTHRLGSARLADRIVVMDKGEIVDIGTHNELLTRPGKYADMYAAQSQWYDRMETETA